MPRKKKQQQKWRYRAGERGCAVTVFERVAGGNLYARVWNPAHKRWHTPKTLGHKDRTLAMQYAEEESQRIKDGRAGKRTWTLGEICTLYETHHVPQKTKEPQYEDVRRCVLWCQVLGAHRVVYDP